MPLLPHVLIYALSFVYVGIYWNNHHHMFHAAKSVTGGVLWANLHLLFWLSLVPFVSGWMGKNYTAPLPVILYGLVLFMCGAAFGILARLLVRHEGPDLRTGQSIRPGRQDPGFGDGLCRSDRGGAVRAFGVAGALCGGGTGSRTLTGASKKRLI